MTRALPHIRFVTGAPIPRQRVEYAAGTRIAIVQAGAEDGLQRVISSEKSSTACSGHVLQGYILTFKQNENIFPTEDALGRPGAPACGLVCAGQRRPGVLAGTARAAPGCRRAKGAGKRAVFHTQAVSGQ